MQFSGSPPDLKLLPPPPELHRQAHEFEVVLPLAFFGFAGFFGEAVLILNFLRLSDELLHQGAVPHFVGLAGGIRAVLAVGCFCLPF